MSEVVRMIEGEGLQERWEEWQVAELLRIHNESRTRQWPNIYMDSTNNLHAIELSGPR
jgi:hypothetical protein